MGILSIQHKGIIMSAVRKENNVIPFVRKSVLASKLAPWHIAQARKQLIAPMLAVSIFWTVFFQTWADVYRVK
jgi:hypothetical protein